MIHPGIPGFGVEWSLFFLFSDFLAGDWNLCDEIAFQEGGPKDVGIAAACGTVERDELGGAFVHAEAGGGLGGMKIDDGQVERFVG